MIVYISGQVTNKENYKEDFAIAENWLIKNGYIPINPTRLEVFNLTYEQYLILDYELIKMCDGIFMLDGWQNSKGACAELLFAKSLSKKVLYQDYYKEFRKSEERNSNREQ